METAVMIVTAAAEKTTAAFRMGFPFTKMLPITKSRIRWLDPQGPPGAFLLNLMLMNARRLRGMPEFSNAFAWLSREPNGQSTPPAFCRDEPTPAAFKYANGLCAMATSTALQRNRRYLSFANALLAGRGIYFATGLVWSPYLGKFRSIICGAFDFCAKG
jgi:hypothetical protein